MPNKSKTRPGAGKRSSRTSSKHRSRHQQVMQALRSFRVIFGSVRQHFRAVEKACGVSGSQLWILKEIDRKAGLGVSELAGRLAIHQSTCSQLVEKLVRGRQVIKSRSADDQRRVGLQLTARGRKTLACAPGPSEGLLPEALAELSDANLASLQRALSTVIAKLDIETREAADEPLADL